MSATSKHRLSHRVFTDSTEKQAVEQYDIKYAETNKPRGGNDVAMLLLINHDKKNLNNQQIKVSHSTYLTLTGIKQQYNMSTKRTAKRKSTTMSVDDSVLTTFEKLLNGILTITVW